MLSVVAIVIRSPPTMWLRVIVIGLSIVIIIIIIIQKFDDKNVIFGLSSRVFLTPSDGLSCLSLCGAENVTHLSNRTVLFEW